LITWPKMAAVTWFMSPTVGSTCNWPKSAGRILNSVRRGNC